MVKKKVVKKSSAQVKKDMALFAEGVERLKELEIELNDLDTRGFARDETKIRAKLKNVSDIPAIEKDIKVLRKKINDKYKPKRKKRKSKVEKELEEVGEKLKDIERVAKKRCAPKRGAIDSGVGMLVDTDFNSFLTDVKSRLSERVRSKEAELDSILKSDLQKRELGFKRKHDDLVNEYNQKKRKLVSDFEKKFDAKVKSSLRREVVNKFNRKLREKLNSEKVVLGKRYRAELKMHAEEKLKKDEDDLRDRYSKRIDSLEASFGRKQERLERELLHKYQDKLDALEDKKKELEKKMKVEMDREVRSFGIKERLLSSKIEKAKEMVELNKRKIEENKKKLIADEKGLETKKSREVAKIKEMLGKKFHRDLDNELVRKERAMRASLKAEYDLLLKQKIAEHDSELKKKKLDLELDIQRKMKEALSA